MSTPEPERDPLADLMQRAVALDGDERERARAAFMRRFDEQERPRSTSLGLRWPAPALTLALSTLTLALLALTWVWIAPKDGGLGYEVSGAADEGGYIHADAGPVEVRFTDRTLVKAAPGARFRVGETHANGASLSVEQGRIEAEVTHTGKSDWRFVAGPFQVRVIGTRFELGWDAATERLEVLLLEGAVEVEGYAGSGPVAVRAGQRFSGDARERRMLVTDARAPTGPFSARGSDAAQQPSTEADATANDRLLDADARETEAALAPGDALSPSDAPAASAREPLEPASAREARAGKGNATTREARASWATWVSKGEFGRVVDEANARGVEQCLTQCSAAELGALADAARYTGRAELAERSLLALRQRFAAVAGDRAAFLLGRLFEGQGQNARARTWYETSLRESPNGSFAAESLAGKMRTVNALQGRAAASALAREYLERYPSGVHAKLARQLLQSP